MIARLGDGVAQPPFGIFAGDEASAIRARDCIQKADIGMVFAAEADDVRAEFVGSSAELLDEKMSPSALVR